MKIRTGNGEEDSRLASSTLSDKKWLVFVGGDQVWTRYGVDLRKVPRGATEFGVSWVDTSALPAPPPIIKRTKRTQEWTLNRASIHPFSFSQLPMQPRVVLRSVSIIQSLFNTSNMVSGTAIFEVERPLIDGENDVVVILYNRALPITHFISPTESSGRGRVCSWTATSSSSKSLAHLSGRISVDNRWPLAFQIEPFDLSKVKAGQQLKFKSWPAPVPPISK